MSFRKIVIGRKPCIVPFCRCTVAHTPNLGTEIICPKHWRLVSRTDRRAYNARKRAVVARMCHEPAAAKGDLFKEITEVNKLWDRLKQQVIEKAVGI
ncbi:MAG: hypothetical protein J0H37_07585 [Hyphomicrobium denitrificans]|nr:hypothetical protein [Hyphomicrobium denitrificans]